MALALAGSLFPANASGGSLAADCAFHHADGSLVISGTGVGNREITIRRGGMHEDPGEIIVEGRFFSGSYYTVPCASPDDGPAPTIHNVDSISVDNLPFVHFDFSNGELAPGRSPEPGSPEIELSIASSGAGIQLLVTAERPTGEPQPPVDFRFGDLGGSFGGNLNADDEAVAGMDVDLISRGDASISVDATAGDDNVDAGGGPGFDGPMAGTLDVESNEGDDRLVAGEGESTFTSRDGDDILVGGDADDSLHEGYGNDVVAAGEGDDVVLASRGHDVLDGGAGRDRLDYGSVRGPILVDLSVTEPQSSGAGTDRQSNFESLVGSHMPDVLYGTTEDNFLYGAAGNDVLVGRGGDDYIHGDFDSDRLFGGPGADRLVGQHHDDRLFGAAGDDLLDGGRADDRLIGGRDRDAFLGGRERDWLLARDGTPDRLIDCGGSRRRPDRLRVDRKDPAPRNC